MAQVQPERPSNWSKCGAVHHQPYNLVETSEYGTLMEEMLHDSIIVGIRDKVLSEKLQMDLSLTLEKAKMQARQKEAIMNIDKSSRVDKVRYQLEHQMQRFKPNIYKGGPSGSLSMRLGADPHQGSQQYKSC